MDIPYRAPALLRDSANGLAAVAPRDELLTQRQLFLTTEVDAAACQLLLEQLMVLEREDPDREIVLYINSPGGEVTSGLVVYDYLRLMAPPLRTVCVGTAASMGSILFLAGDRREMFPHAKLMIHDPSFANAAPGVKPLDMQEQVDRLMEVRRTLGSIIAERTGRTLKEVYAKTKRDTFLGAEEALRFGLATAILDHT